MVLTHYELALKKEMIKEKRLVIKSAVKFINPHGGLVTYNCLMNDGSTWSYSPTTKSFVREVPPLSELNECLNQQLQKSLPN